MRRGGIIRFVAYLANQPLYGFLPPHPHAPLQCIELSMTVSSRVAGLKLDEKLERRLIRSLIKTSHHLAPVLLENIRTAAARFVAKSVGRFLVQLSRHEHERLGARDSLWHCQSTRVLARDNLAPRLIITPPSKYLIAFLQCNQPGAMVFTPVRD